MADRVDELATELQNQLTEKEKDFLAYLLASLQADEKHFKVNNYVQ